jgi:GT2 family glycosyltransferase
MSPNQSAVLAVILLTMNQREKTLRCLDSIARVRRPTYPVLVWDNDSQDGTVEAVQAAYDWVFVHRHHENAGVASGRNMAANLAMQLCKPQFLFFMDNDMVVTAGCLEALVAPFEEQARLAQTTGKILDMDHPGRIYGAGGNRIRFWLGDTKHVGYGETDRGQYDKAQRCIPSGGCMLVRTDVFQQLAGFDPIFDPYGPEDLDFGLRVNNAGYHALYVPRAVVFHESKPGRTFEGGIYTERFATLRAQHWFIFMRRHATPWQRLGFLLIGVPCLLSTFLLRQARRGNLFPAVRGLMRGTLKYVHDTMFRKHQSSVGKP